MTDYIIRAILAIGFSLFLILLTLVLIILASLNYLSFKETKEAIEIIAPILTGYIGSIIGYYFAREEQELQGKVDTWVIERKKRKMSSKSQMQRSDQAVKSFLALLFPVALMIIILVLLLLLMMSKLTFANFKDGIAVTSSLLTGYIGTIMGYYFGKDTTKK